MARRKTNHRGLILIVDDVPQNLQVLRSTLEKENYRIAAANSGEVALRYLQKKTPDLVLLDVMMPIMNGFEVCQKIKAQEPLAHVPVIFLTARTEKEDVVAGFESGGIDYITKPFNTAELLSRVKTHIELKRARDSIENYNRELQSLNDEKTEIMDIAAHDLKNPLTAILMHAQALMDRNEAEGENHKSGQAIQRSGEKMLGIVSNLLDMQRLESGKEDADIELVDLVETVGQLIKDHQAHATKKQIDLRWQASDDILFAETDWRLLQQALDNLLSNALKYSPHQSQVSVSVKPYRNGETECVAIAIQDSGPGFSETDREQMFKKFARLSARPTGDEDSTGLGLSIVKRLCELLQLELKLETSEQGSCFTVLLPRKTFELDLTE